MNTSHGLISQSCPVTRALLPNRVRQFAGFHISHNPRTTDYGCATSALVLRGRVFFVLNGDHVGALVDAAEQDGVQGCIDYFIARIDQANDLSEHRMAVALVADPFDLHTTTLEAIGHGNVERIVAAISGARS